MKTREIPRTIHYSLLTIHKPLRGFTLVEILIVVAILGILAAVVIPEYRNYTQKAKESAAKESLQLLRSSIERYAIQHDGTPPGYPNGDTSANPHYVYFVVQLTKASNENGRTADVGTAGYPLGPYFKEIPSNPLVNFNPNMVGVMPANMNFPGEAAGTMGWFFKPSTKEVKLNAIGTDTQGKRYYDY